MELSTELLKYVPENLHSKLKLLSNHQIGNILEIYLAVDSISSDEKKAVNPVELGQIGEDKILKMLSERYKTTFTGKQSRSTDMIVEYMDHKRIYKLMIEVKNYSKRVQKREVDKFLRDLDNHTEAYGGIFVSINTEIVNDDHFIKFYSYKGKYVFHISILENINKLLLPIVDLLFTMIITNHNIVEIGNETLTDLNDILNTLRLFDQIKFNLTRTMESSNRSINHALLDLQHIETTILTKIDTIYKKITNDEIKMITMDKFSIDDIMKKIKEHHIPVEHEIGVRDILSMFELKSDDTESKVHNLRICTTMIEFNHVIIKFDTERIVIELHISEIPKFVLPKEVIPIMIKGDIIHIDYCPKSIDYLKSLLSSIKL